jgi:hypothetical protein
MTNIRTLSGVNLLLLLLFSLTQLPALAKDPVLPPFEDTVQVEGQNLVLNGAGTLAVNRVKIYKVGFYLPARKSTAQDVLDLPGITRIKIQMLKSVESETMSRRFIADIHANNSKDDRVKIVNQLLTLGLGFGSIGDWNVGDVMTIDWIPAKGGTIISWNGKVVGDPFKDRILMQCILRIWIGDTPYDAKLKRLLLGEKE